MKHLLQIILLSCLFISIAEARPPGAKAARQNARIKNGVRSGTLTHDEGAALRNEQKDIREMRKSARKDGKLSKEERKNINQAQREASKNIYEQKHDGDNRPRREKFEKRRQKMIEKGNH